MNRKNRSKMFNGKRVLEAKDTIRQEVIQDEISLTITVPTLTMMSSGHLLEIREQSLKKG